MLICDFVRDEVERQGHDLWEPTDGQQRIAWMLEAWLEAIEYAKNHKHPRIEHIKELGMMIEPENNDVGFRECNVRVGEYVAPHFGEVLWRLEALWKTIEEADSDIFYREFEKIHPFVDGNGRTGKILHNWLNGTLYEPVLVKDWFGHGIP